MSFLSILGKVTELVSSRKLEIVLASQSPRRKELLEKNIFNDSVPFVVRSSDFKEDYDKALYADRAEDYVKDYAKEKARDVSSSMEPLENNSHRLVIGCDTVVVYNGKILEKPSNDNEAYEMLMSYGGKTQSVISGVCIRLSSCVDSNVSHFEDVFHCETKVNFGPMLPESVKKYIEIGEPNDKAGGYGIQGLGAGFISGIDGCYFNVVGLPVYELSSHIYKIVNDHL